MVFASVFYAFNEFGRLYFRASRCTLRPQCSVQLVARIKGVNEIIWSKKCGGFGGYFYAFNEFGGLYFRASRCTLRPQCSVQLVARIKDVNKLI